MKNDPTAPPTQRILICNERFLSRFGVDRILILLAKHLVAQGMTIIFVCLRCEEARLRQITDGIEVLIIPEGTEFVAIDGIAATETLQIAARERVDIIVSGGWPFFGVAARATRIGVRSVFIDAGAVPHDGFDGDSLHVQRELRRLRQATLPYFNRILPISRFIRATQTEPDRGTGHGVTTIYLGADHLAAVHAAPPDRQARRIERHVAKCLDAQTRRGNHLVLVLGRIEMVGYKNSASVFDLLRSMRAQRSDVHFVVLAGSDAFETPRDVQAHVTSLPNVSDRSLQTIMTRCALGVSVSRWEGFNLPLAEMQWLARPVLAFAVGAHPEVIADPWFLCDSVEEMRDKGLQILSSGVPASVKAHHRFQRFRERFTWQNTLTQWTQAILRPTPDEFGRQASQRRLILVDVSNSSRDPGNSGVIRVTRRLTAALAERTDVDLVYVKWRHDAKRYEGLTSDDLVFLSSNAGPSDWIGALAATLRPDWLLDDLLRAADPRLTAPPVLFLPEVVLDGTADTRVAWGRQREYRIAFILYDMLPVYAAHYIDEDVTRSFPSYLEALRGSDAIYAISGFSLQECERWHRENGYRLPDDRKTVWLPAQFSNRDRVSTPPPMTSEVHVLCVSTIEPRKNHRTLIEAFQLVRQRTKLPLRLHLVGNSYAGADGLADWIRAAAHNDRAIIWHGILSDDALEAEYRRASFTVYPSLTEGFGLPIMESLWMGRPCLCHNTGVMAELAAAGGCCTVDMSNAAATATACERLATDQDFRESLTRQALAREVETWQSYGSAIASRLCQLQ